MSRLASCSSEEEEIQDATIPPRHGIAASARLRSRYSQCEGLVDAARYVDDCKEMLRLDQPTFAAVNFLIAFNYSAFSLKFMQHDNHNLLGGIQEFEHPAIGNRFIAICARTARAVMTGWKVIDFPLHDDQLKLTTATRFCVPNLDEQQMSGADLVWTFRAGQFKVLWTLINKLDLIRPDKGRLVTTTSAITQAERDKAVDTLHEAFSIMMSINPNHPVTLQAAMLMHDFPQCRLPTSCNPDDMLHTGFLYAVVVLADPAAAMQHLLFCMYWELQHCQGNPSPDVKQRLHRAATEVVQSYDIILAATSGQEFWQMVRIQLVPSMLLLARSFNLCKILDHPSFLTLLQKQHRQVQQQFADAKSPNAHAPHDSARATARTSKAQHMTSHGKPRSQTASTCACCQVHAKKHGRD